MVTAAALLLTATTRTASAGSKTEGTIRIGSATGFVGETVEVDVLVDVEPPGLGAWTVDPIWDTDVVSAESCFPYHGGVCSMDFGDGEGRVTGASATGIVGATSLATLTFRCADRPGRSDLRISVEVFADAADPPQDIDEELIEGEITCVQRAPSLRIGSATMSVGQSQRIGVDASNLPVDPGLGSWSILVHYDASKVGVRRCEVGQLLPEDPGVNTCRTELDTGSIFIQGASADGLDVEHNFAEFDVSCHSVGESSLSATVSVWAIPTVGLVEIPLPEIANGSITCTEATQPAPPPAGSGPAPSSTAWLPLAIAALGAVATLTALPIRRKFPSPWRGGARGGV